MRRANFGASPILKFLERKIDALEATLERLKITPVLRNTGPEVFLHLRTLEERIDALEWREQPLNPPFRKPLVQQEGALWLRLPSEDELSDLIANFPNSDTRPYPTRKRLLFEFGRQWQSVLTTGKMVSCDKSVADANAISEALYKLRVPVNPDNNGDQPDQLSDSPDA